MDPTVSTSSSTGRKNHAPDTVEDKYMYSCESNIYYHVWHHFLQVIVIKMKSHTPCRDSQIFTTSTTVSSAFRKEPSAINISHFLHPIPPTDWFHLQCWWIQYQPRNRTGCVETLSSHVIREPGRVIFRCSGCHHQQNLIQGAPNDRTLQENRFPIRTFLNIS